jgi:hypothetical protein
MKRLAVIVIAINLVGCTTVRTVDGTPSELRQHIESGGLLKSGDRVKIVTSDRQKHEFAVTAVHNGTIEGKDAAVPVASVVAMTKRTVSVGKTLALVGAVALVYIGVLGSQGAFVPKISLGGALH